MEPFKKRNVLLDFTKVISALLIVGLHCSIFYDVNIYLYHVTSNGFFKIFVAFFFCINGYFLFSVFEKKKFKKWLKRILILYIIWTIVYSYFWLRPFSLFKTILVLLFGFNHLWYLVTLIFGAILLNFTKNIKPKLLLFTAGFLFLTGLVLQYLNYSNVLRDISLLKKLLNFPPFYRNFLFYGYPFLIIGFLLNKESYIHKIKKSFTLTFLIISVFIMVLDSLINKALFTSKIIVQQHAAFLLLAPVLLIFVLKNNIHLKIDSKMLSDLAIAIYLIHPLVIYIFINNFNFAQTALALLSMVMSFFSGILLVKINKRLKYLL